MRGDGVRVVPHPRAAHQGVLGLEDDAMNALYTIGFWIAMAGVTLAGALRLVEFAIEAWFQHTLKKFA